MPQTGTLPFGMNSFVGSSNQFSNSLKSQYQNMDPQQQHMMQNHLQFMPQLPHQALADSSYSTLINSPQSNGGFQLHSSISQPNALNILHNQVLNF